MKWRLIPTFVGNTAWADARPISVEVNPHVRGEHEAIYILSLLSGG